MIISQGPPEKSSDPWHLLVQREDGDFMPFQQGDLRKIEGEVKL